MNYQCNSLRRGYSIDNRAALIGAEIFPAVLHSMLDEVEEKGFSHIVSWQPHGRCFIVHNRQEFVQFVMPAFFRMSKFASFQRQLNLYDFKRITAGPDKGGYYHENFLRNRRELCKRILRQQGKGPIARKPASETEPDFYRINTGHNAPSTIPSGRQEGNIKNSTCLSDLTKHAVVGQSAPMTCVLGNVLEDSKQVFSVTPSNPCAIDRETYSAMACGDLHVAAGHSLVAAMRAATRFQQFCLASSAPAFFDHERPDWYGGASASVASQPCKPHAIREKRELKGSNQEGGISVVSMLSPSRYSRGEETRSLLNRNAMETQFVTNEYANDGDLQQAGFDIFFGSDMFEQPRNCSST